MYQEKLEEIRKEVLKDIQNWVKTHGSLDLPSYENCNKTLPGLFLYDKYDSANWFVIEKVFIDTYYNDNEQIEIKVYCIDSEIEDVVDIEEMDTFNLSILYEDYMNVTNATAN